VLASWKEFGFGANADVAGELAEYARRTWGLQLAPAKLSRIARQATSLGVLLSAVRDARDRNPHWLTARHEALVVDSEDGFRALSAAAGLEFSSEAAKYLAESDQQGEGYATKRDRSALTGKWQRVLTEDDVEVLGNVFADFPEHVGLLGLLQEREFLA
jgi:hypothetical protein